jgi:hypothetical protein
MISQVIIFVLGVPALWLVGRPEKWSRWGFVLGLLAQPAWYYSTITNHQYGIVALNVFYTFCWLQGIYYGFIKKSN